jgi:hypothetical protein
MEQQQFVLQAPEVLEYNDDGTAYIPIWAVENDLDTLTGYDWSRNHHHYSFDTDSTGLNWLSTSLELHIAYMGRSKTLLCGSRICISSYQDNSNLIQTGIAEATKAGVKVLGIRFGKELNERTVLKTSAPKKKVPIKRKPDAKVMKVYTEAVMKNNVTEQERLLSMYDIKTEKDYAKS